MTITYRQIAGIARTVIITIALAGPFAVTPARAWQFAGRKITGTVTDGHHEPLRGAVIQVHNEANDTVMSYITGKSGTYTFKRLDANTDYDISATYQGHRSKRKELSHFDSKPNRVIDLSIKME